MSECMLKLEGIVAGYGYGPDIIQNINLELNKGCLLYTSDAADE